VNRTLAIASKPARAKRLSGTGRRSSRGLPTLADVLQALSDPVRLHIIRRAAQRELACCEFGLDLPKATLSHHFKVLREAGIIAVRHEGTRHLTSLNRDELEKRFPGLLQAVLAATAE
jgi:DNA-binding transcriptional ArsR family regulator